MLEMNTKMYNDLIEMSFSQQFKRGIDGHGSTIGKALLITTSIDLGRQTGKTEALVNKVIRDAGTGVFTYYVGHSMMASKIFLDRIAEKQSGKRICVGLTSKRSRFVDSMRGVIQESQAVNIIFDECGMSHEQQHEFIASIRLQMERGNPTHPYPYIHVIRMGM